MSILKSKCKYSLRLKRHAHEKCLTKVIFFSFDISPDTYRMIMAILKDLDLLNIYFKKFCHFPVTTTKPKLRLCVQV